MRDPPAAAHTAPTTWFASAAAATPAGFIDSATIDHHPANAHPFAANASAGSFG